MGVERKIVQKRCVFFFLGKHHDNKFLNSKILLSRNFAVIAQAPKLLRGSIKKAAASFGQEGTVPEPPFAKPPFFDFPYLSLYLS